MRAVHTIGYEGASVIDFIHTLTRAGIDMVLDIRQLPQSRRPGFSKNSLSAALSDAGIAYRHVRPLGDPKPGRDAARRGDYGAFEAIFSAHLETSEAVSALEEAGRLVGSHKIVLLCYERDPKLCHRSIVAKRLAERSTIRIMHLGVAVGRSQGGCQDDRQAVGVA